MSTKNDCPNCEILRKEVTELKERIAKLEEEIRQSKRQATPFSKGKKKENPKKPGRKKGKGDFKYRKPPSADEINETKEAPLEKCPDCGSKVVDCKAHKSFQEDIEIRKVSTCFITYSAYCKKCNKTVRSLHPEQTSKAVGCAGTFLGPNIKALSAQLKHNLGVPFAKIRSLFSSFNFNVTQSGLCQSNERLAQKAQSLYEDLCKELCSACCVGADETGWRIGVLNAWLWVFTSKTATVYHIDEGRSHKVVLKILGKKFKGVLSADCFSAYDHKALKDWTQQKCFAHLLSTLKKMKEKQSGGSLRFSRDVSAILKQAIQLKKEKDSFSKSQFIRRRKKIERTLDALIDTKRKFSDPENARFARRLKKQRRHLFQFLYFDEVEPTNNQSERMIRPAVISRKTGACNKTHKGAKTHAILASLLTTVLQRGYNVIDFFRKLILSPKPSINLLPLPSL